MAYNPPRAGQVNTGGFRRPSTSSGGGLSANVGRATVFNSPYKDNRSPESVYNTTLRQETAKYDDSALKQFFDFALSDTVKDTVDSVLTNQAENQLGDLIANSPDIVEGWKQGDPTQRAYISNLNPIAQNLIEENLANQVANEYMGKVNAGLAASDILVSATATPEQLTAERSRIMSEAGASTGYTSLDPYWIAKTSGDISRVQAANEAKLDGMRQKKVAALGVAKYGDGLASELLKMSNELGFAAPQLNEEQTAQALALMSNSLKEEVVMGLNGTLTTPATNLKALLSGLDATVEKLIAEGSEDEAESLITTVQEMAAKNDIILENGVNYWGQRDAEGNSGYELLNRIATRAAKAAEEGDRMDATKWAEGLKAQGISNDEIMRLQPRLYPGQQSAVVTVLTGQRQIEQMVTDEDYQIYAEAITNPNLTPEAAIRIGEENNLPFSLRERLLDKARGTGEDPAAKQLQTEFGAALQGERVGTSLSNLAAELADPQRLNSPEVKALKRSLRIPEGTDDVRTILDALERTVRTDAFGKLESLDAEGKLQDKDGNPVGQYVGAERVLLDEIKTIRQTLKLPPEPDKPDEGDPNLEVKQALKNYATRRAAGVQGLALYDRAFIDSALKQGIINEGMNEATKASKLGDHLRIRAEEITLNGKPVYANTVQVQKVMRGELDPFTLRPPVNQAPEVNPGSAPRGSARRFYKRPEPTPSEAPNPFAEPPRMIDMPPMDGMGGGPEDEEQASAGLQRFREGLAQIANVALDVLTGAAPASAQVDYEEGTGELAYIWTRRKPLEAGTRPLPQINGNVVVKVVPLTMSGPKHPYFVSIGIAEGTRTPNGGFTKAWYGHSDPGDSNYNRGTVSGGRGPTRGMTPEQVDNYYMNELTALSLGAAPVLQQYGLKPNAQIWHRAMFNYLDLHVQSPAAARDFLRKIPEAIKAGGQIEAFAKIRADSYRDPVSGRLYTSFASYGDLLRDQRSRAGAFDYRKRL